MLTRCQNTDLWITPRYGAYGKKYDGILSSAANRINYFLPTIAGFPFHIDVIGLADEEGTRFQSTLLGSKVHFRHLQTLAMLTAEDANGEVRGCFVSFLSAVIQTSSGEDAYEKEDVLGLLSYTLQKASVRASQPTCRVVTAMTGLPPYLIDHWWALLRTQ